MLGHWIKWFRVIPSLGDWIHRPSPFIIPSLTTFFSGHNERQLGDGVWECSSLSTRKSFHCIWSNVSDPSSFLPYSFSFQVVHRILYHSPHCHSLPYMETTLLGHFYSYNHLCIRYAIVSQSINISLTVFLQFRSRVSLLPCDSSSSRWSGSMDSDSREVRRSEGNPLGMHVMWFVPSSPLAWIDSLSLSLSVDVTLHASLTSSYLLWRNDGDGMYFSSKEVVWILYWMIEWMNLPQGGNQGRDWVVMIQSLLRSTYSGSSTSSEQQRSMKELTMEAFKDKKTLVYLLISIYMWLVRSFIWVDILSRRELHIKIDFLPGSLTSWSTTVSHSLPRASRLFILLIQINSLHLL